MAFVANVDFADDCDTAVFGQIIRNTVGIYTYLNYSLIFCGVLTVGFIIYTVIKTAKKEIKTTKLKRACRNNRQARLVFVYFILYAN